MKERKDLTEQGNMVLQAIQSYKVGEDLRNTVTEKLSGEYNKLRDFIYDWKEKGADLEVTRSYIEEIEQLWCAENFEDVPKNKHKNGKWKYRTLLPKGYSSAKSVIISALALGVLDNVSGKSALERKIKEAMPVGMLEYDPAADMRKTFLKLEIQIKDYVGDPPLEHRLIDVVEALGELHRQFGRMLPEMPAFPIIGTLSDGGP